MVKQDLICYYENKNKSIRCIPSGFIVHSGIVHLRTNYRVLKWLKMRQKEKELELRCCEYARQNGFASIKLEKNGHTGIPDRVFIKKGGKTCFIEFKNPNKKGVVSQQQRFWKSFIGENYFIVESFHDFQAILAIFMQK